MGIYTIVGLTAETIHRYLHLHLPYPSWRSLDWLPCGQVLGDSVHPAVV